MPTRHCRCPVGARGQLVELRGRDLKFTPPEIELLLRTHLKPSIDAEVVDALHSRTEGWAVGLRLATISLRDLDDRGQFLAAIQTDSRPTADYLVDEVLAHQPMNVQGFLLHTAILARFCAEAAAAVADISVVEAQRVLDHVRDTNLFLVDLDDQDRWFRYHHQFQAMLMDRLQRHAKPAAIAALHCRAGEWFASQNLVDDGVRHFLAANDPDRATELIEANLPRVLEAEAYQELARWLRRLPAGLVHERPGLLIAQAWLCYTRLEYALVVQLASKAAWLPQEGTDGLEDAIRRALVAECDILAGAVDLERSLHERLASLERGLTDLPEERAQGRAFALNNIALYQQRLGQTQEAIRLLRAELGISAARSPAVRAQLLTGLASVLHRAGRLDEAQHAAEQLRELALRHDLPISASFAEVIIGLVYCTRQELEAAEPHLLAVMNKPYLAHRLALVGSAFPLVEIYVEQNRIDSARRVVTDLRRSIEATGDSEGFSHLEKLEARLALQTGNLPQALRWAERTSRAAPILLDDDTLLILAEILLASGTAQHLREAEVLLRSEAMRYQANGYRRRYWQALVRLALTLAAQGRDTEASGMLAVAIAEAAPLGFVRMFVTAGPAIIGLLQTLARSGPHADLAQDLLGKALPAQIPPSTPRPAPGSSDVLLGPLSFREQEVLELLAQRLSNKEIATRLHLSPVTVRNHTSSIYSKLHVAGRVEAVQRAREAGLLGQTQPANR